MTQKISWGMQTVEPNWSIREHQPMHLHILAALQQIMQDPDTSLFPSLLEGVGPDSALPFPLPEFSRQSILNTSDYNLYPCTTQTTTISSHVNSWRKRCPTAGFFVLPLRSRFFFHEYGRRAGMVPRSSLKGGKNSLMVEKRTRKPNTTQNQQTPQPRAHRPCLHHHVVFPLCKVKHVRRERV